MGGSRLGRRADQECLVEIYNGLLFKGYFLENLVFDEIDFTHVNHMRRPFCVYCKQSQNLTIISLKIMNVAGKLGLSSLQKATSAMHMLAYGNSSKAQEEHTRMAKSTAQEAMS